MRIAPYFILWPLLLAVIAGCSNLQKTDVNFQSGSMFILADATPLDAGLYRIDFVQDEAYYPVFYIGPVRDTIRLEQEPVSPFYDPHRDARYDTTRCKTLVKNLNASILVDTCMYVSYVDKYFHTGEQNEDVLDSIACYEAFPVVIKNKSDSLMFFGTFNAVTSMIREAKNLDGDQSRKE